MKSFFKKPVNYELKEVDIIHPPPWNIGTSHSTANFLADDFSSFVEPKSAERE